MRIKKKEDPKKYVTYCNACGEIFNPERIDARFCGDGCRIGYHNKFNKMKLHVPELSPEQQEKYEEITKVKDGATGLIKRVLKPGKSKGKKGLIEEVSTENVKTEIKTDEAGKANKKD